MRPTPSMEDYLETIYELIRSKGYARVSDIALALNLQPSSVTRMVQRLDEQNFVTYERYRGLVLTERGEAIGRAMRQRHETLATFLRLLGVHDEEVVQQDVEGIEHHVSRQTLERIERFVAFARANPAWMNQLHAAMNTGGSAAGPGNAGGPPAGETAGGPDVPESRGSGRPAWDGRGGVAGPPPGLPATRLPAAGATAGRVVRLQAATRLPGPPAARTARAGWPDRPVLPARLAADVILENVTRLAPHQLHLGPEPLEGHDDDRRPAAHPGQDLGLAGGPLADVDVIVGDDAETMEPLGNPVLEQFEALELEALVVVHHLRQAPLRLLGGGIHQLLVVVEQGTLLLPQFGGQFLDPRHGSSPFRSSGVGGAGAPAGGDPAATGPV